jgi:hypothetical protein
MKYYTIRVDAFIFIMLYSYVQVQHPCKNAPCSGICLLAPNKTYACACGESQILGADKHTCYGELC